MSLNIGKIPIIQEKYGKNVLNSVLLIDLMLNTIYMKYTIWLVNYTIYKCFKKNHTKWKTFN